jgi:hypothetical protein
MTRFRALAVSGALLLGFSFNFVGCFDHGDPCIEQAAGGGTGSTSDPCDN